MSKKFLQDKAAECFEVNPKLKAVWVTEDGRCWLSHYENEALSHSREKGLKEPPVLIKNKKPAQESKPEDNGQADPVEVKGDEEKEKEAVSDKPKASTKKAKSK